MKRSSVLFWIAIGFAGIAAAQNAPPHPPTLQIRLQPGPMELDVVVTDNAGHPVSGLQQSDFTLLDDRRPTPIRAFRALGAGSAAGNPTQVIIVIDEVNTPFDAVSIERIQLHNLLTRNGGHLPLPVTVLFVSDTGIQQINQPSTDGMALDAKVRQQDGTLREIARSSGFYGGADRFDISLKWVGALAASLQKVPGRKQVIWVSQGWWMFDSPNVYLTDRQMRQIFGAVVDLSDSLWHADAVMYAVDPLGTSDAGAFRNLEWQQFLKPVRQVDHAEPGDLALQVLSSQSGGLVFYGSNDVAGEISKCVDDGSAWYALAFDPQPADKPATWHDLAVKLDKPGLKVRTRSGYYAGP